MRGRILLLGGLAIGFVLGARAGRGAYDDLRARVDAVRRNPTVQDAAGAAVHAVEAAVPAAVEGIQRAARGSGERPASTTSPTPATIGEDVRPAVPSGDDPALTATD